MNARSVPLLWIALSAILSFPAESPAQLRRPGWVTVKREDRNKSELLGEEGAIYLENLLPKEVVVRVTAAVSAYGTLQGDRWLGNLIPDQRAVLLAVSERAYRVRAKAQQGQVAGWVAKSAVAGLPPDFETKLEAYHARYEAVQELIENHQIALGMTLSEVVESVGPPDKRSSKVTADGRVDSLEFISYERVPQTGIAYDSFGRPYTTTQYIEVESGRVTVDFNNDLVTSISESEGIELPAGPVVVPPPVFLY